MQTTTVKGMENMPLFHNTFSIATCRIVAPAHTVSGHRLHMPLSGTCDVQHPSSVIRGQDGCCCVSKPALPCTAVRGALPTCAKMLDSPGPHTLCGSRKGAALPRCTRLRTYEVGHTVRDDLLVQPVQPLGCVLCVERILRPHLHP